MFVVLHIKFHTKSQIRIFRVYQIMNNAINIMALYLCNVKIDLMY